GASISITNLFSIDAFYSPCLLRFFPHRRNFPPSSPLSLSPSHSQRCTLINVQPQSLSLSFRCINGTTDGYAKKGEFFTMREGDEMRRRGEGKKEKMQRERGENDRTRIE